MNEKKKKKKIRRNDSSHLRASHKVSASTYATIAPIDNTHSCTLAPTHHTNSFNKRSINICVYINMFFLSTFSKLVVHGNCNGWKCIAIVTTQRVHCIEYAYEYLATSICTLISPSLPSAINNQKS